MSLKKLLITAAVLVALALAGPAAASNCHGIMTTPGYHDAYTSTIDVHVSRYLGMTCNRALRVGAAAYLATRSVGQFGYGDRPFHVGRLSCWLNARGSDFTDAACWHGHGRQREYAKFTDHRNY
jgi:hypothetical protein